MHYKCIVCNEIIDPSDFEKALKSNKHQHGPRECIRAMFLEV